MRQKPCEPPSMPIIGTKGPHKKPDPVGHCDVICVGFPSLYVTSVCTRQSGNQSGTGIMAQIVNPHHFRSCSVMYVSEPSAFILLTILGGGFDLTDKSTLEKSGPDATTSPFLEKYAPAHPDKLTSSKNRMPNFFISVHPTTKSRDTAMLYYIIASLECRTTGM